MDLSDAIREIERAARTLAPEQGRIARRNARGRVLRALKAARGAMDRAFPAIRPEGRKRRAPRSPSEQIRHLKKTGWEEMLPNEVAIVARCSAAGVKAKVINLPTDSSGKVTKAITLLPEWAAEIARRYADDKKLVEAKKSKKVRDGLMAILNLHQSA